MKNIYEILQAKQKHFLELQKEVEAVAREIDALTLTARLLMEDEGERRPVSGSEPTQAEMIRDIIKDKGHPMHVSAIGKVVQAKYKKKLKSTYLTAVIFRQIKKGKLFIKTAPNTFGLLEWQVTQSNGAKAIDLEKAAM
jgi:hypothetical protein